MSMQAAIGLLQTIETQLEDLWIERQALGFRLRQDGYTEEQVVQLLSEAKLNPEARARAQEAYASMREALERAIREAAMEAIMEDSVGLEWPLMSELTTVMAKWSDATAEITKKLGTSSGEERTKQEILLGTLSSCLNDLLEAVDRAGVTKPQIGSS